MKEKVVFILGLCALVFAQLKVKDYLPKNYKIDDEETLKRELKVLLLCENIYQPLRHAQKILDGFDPANNLNLFSEPKLIEEFSRSQLLGKGEIFSVYYQEHLDQAILLFKIFYDAKDFDTFYKTAVWSRDLANEGLWLYSFSVALVHRPDTFGLILPPIYEINPYLFYNNEVITAAQQYKQKHESQERRASTIWDDLSNRYTNQDLEQIEAYFTEDIGLNAFYYNYHIFYPWWMDGNEFGLASDHRGELFYYVLTQLVARYNLERLSNNLEEVPALDFESPLDFGYYPSQRYSNGVEFPSRPQGVCLSEARKGALIRNNNFTNAYTRLRDFAFRIQNVVDLGRAYVGVEIYKDVDNGLESLSNLLEGNPNSPNLPYYGSLQIYARHLLGYAPESLNVNKRVPAATQHYETTLRDPGSWRFFKWLLNFYNDFYNRVEPYKPQELEFPGVSIGHVEVEDFTTYFDSFTSDLSNAVFYSEKDDAEKTFEVYVRQNRLQHLPLAYNITVGSDREATAIIKTFLGPKYDRYGQPLDITENRDKFYVLDHFSYSLKKGQNVIVRNTGEGPSSGDRTSFKMLLDRVSRAIRKEEEFVVDGGEAYWAFPNRLLLPKGTTTGLECQLYVILIESPGKLEGNLEDRTYKRIGTGRHTGNQTLRFPLDRRIDMNTLTVPNAKVVDAVIHHKVYN